MNRTLFFLALTILLCTCAEKGRGRVDQHIVENHTPEPRLEIVPVENLASTAEILELQKAFAEKAKAEQAKAEQAQAEQAQGSLKPSRPVPLTPETVRKPSKAEKASKIRQAIAQDDGTVQTARAYRRKILGEGKLQALPLPETLKTSRTLKPDLLAPNRARAKPKTPKKTTPPKARRGGNQLFEVVPEQRALNALVPPGQFFRARLLGNVLVTAFDTPVFAEILDAQGSPLGIAVGSAGLHPNNKERALVRFTAVHLHEGATISGSLEGFEQDLSLGLQGRASRKGIKAVFNALTETVLAALSLEVDTGSDFGSVFQFQLADRLMQQAQDRLDEMDLERTVTLQRDTAFWVASTKTVNVKEQPGRATLGTLTQSAFDATVSAADLTGARKQALTDAYARLSRRLNAR